MAAILRRPKDGKAATSRLGSCADLTPLPGGRQHPDGVSRSARSVPTSGPSGFPESLNQAPRRRRRSVAVPTNGDNSPGIEIAGRGANQRPGGREHAAAVVPPCALRTTWRGRLPFPPARHTALGGRARAGSEELRHCVVPFRAQPCGFAPVLPDTPRCSATCSARRFAGPQRYRPRPGVHAPTCAALRPREIVWTLRR
jgi:hypothetical protein